MVRRLAGDVVVVVELEMMSSLALGAGDVVVVVELEMMSSLALDNNVVSLGA